MVLVVVVVVVTSICRSSSSSSGSDFYGFPNCLKRYYSFPDMVSTNCWQSCIKVAILYAHEKSKELRQKRRSFTDMSRKSSWLPGVLRSSSKLLLGGSARSKRSVLPALLRTAAQRFLSNSGNR